LQSTEPPVFCSRRVSLASARFQGTTTFRWLGASRFKQANGGKPDAVVYLLPDATHYFYITEQAFVVRVTPEFLLGNLGN
jgi:hypothetical protein